ncbi:MAG TPA: hypothetical protein VK470_05385 [Bacteroidota bacterium]|nr:hypothetical protein [Bacteroidota bacterium]
MEKRMYGKDEAARIIKSGKSVILAADEAILASMPKGNWIGGSIPYFIGEDGGEFTKEKVYVTEIPEFALSNEIKVYTADSISAIYKDAKNSGFTFVIIPGFSKTHSEFAIKGPTFENFGHSPLIGWISGFDLKDIGTASAKVVDGRTGTAYSDGAIAFHVELPASKVVDLQIVNIFDQGVGDSITFPENGFSATIAVVNGIEVNFADYVTTHKINTQLPLVADMYGALINTSFQSVDCEKKTVQFYAPVFKGIEYKIGAPISDYVADFTSKLPKGIDQKIFFSCNCILNYLYAGLEGKKTGEATGPITFGEIAYQLLNQTMTYLTIDDAR